MSTLSPVHGHVIVDNLRTDPWAVTAAIAAIVAAAVGTRALIVAICEVGFAATYYFAGLEQATPLDTSRACWS